MTLSRNLILALTVTGSAAVAAVLAARRARRLEAAQHKTDLQTWENEGGRLVPNVVVKPPS